MENKGKKIAALLCAVTFALHFGIRGITETAEESVSPEAGMVEPDGAAALTESTENIEMLVTEVEESVEAEETLRIGDVWKGTLFAGQERTARLEAEEAEYHIVVKGYGITLTIRKGDRSTDSVFRAATEAGELDRTWTAAKGSYLLTLASEAGAGFELQILTEEAYQAMTTVIPEEETAERKSETEEETHEEEAEAPATEEAEPVTEEHTPEAEPAAEEEAPAETEEEPAAETEEPAAEETPAAEEEPVTETEAPAPEEEPAAEAEEEPAAETETPVETEEPAAEEEPVTETEAPAAEEEPATAEETPVPEEEPAAETEAPAETEEPAAEETPAAEEEPVTETEAPAPEEEPAAEAEEEPAAETETPVETEEPAAEEEPVTETEAPAAEEEPTAEEETNVPEEEPAAETETPAETEEPAAEEEPVTETEAPAAEEEPTAEETPVPEEEPAAETEAPAETEEPAAEETPAAEEEPVTETEAPAAEEEPGAEEEPAPEGTPDASEGDTAAEAETEPEAAKKPEVFLTEDELAELGYQKATVIAEKGTAVYAQADAGAEIRDQLENGAMIWILPEENGWGRMQMILRTEEGYRAVQGWLQLADTALYVEEQPEEQPEVPVIRTISLHSSMEGMRVVHPGDEIRLSAELGGFLAEDIYTVQWQYSTDGITFTDVEGATDLECIYTLNRENYNWIWALTITLQAGEEAVIMPAE